VREDDENAGPANRRAVPHSGMLLVFGDGFLESLDRQAEGDRYNGRFGFAGRDSGREKPEILDDHADVFAMGTHWPGNFVIDPIPRIVDRRPR
jgi:hypothetical protein